MKARYKQTEVGVIPEDWEIQQVKSFSLITTGSRNTQDKVDCGEFPFFVRSQTVERINTYSFEGEAVLTAGDGVGTGKVFHYINSKFDFHQRVYKISDFSSRVNGFYFYLYFSNHFLNRIMQMTAKSSVDSVRMEMIADMKIPLPPTLAEQTAIATALSDTDELIQSLEKLVAKKSLVKQGTMQELLKPKAGWVEKSLQEVADLCRENILPLNYPDVMFTHFSLPSFDLGKVPIRESGSCIGSNKFRVPAKAILVSKLNPRIPRVWMPIYIPDTSVASTEFLILLPKEPIIREFLFVACSAPHFTQQMEFLATGTTGSHQRMSPNDVMDMSIAIPSAIDEQRRIADILATMDAELAALEAKLDKYRQIKKGMVQELLTGRIRLV